MLESVMIWRLLQVRHLYDIPLIYVGPIWKGLVDWASAQMLRPGFDWLSRRIPRCVDTADEAIAIVREHHERWQAAQVKTF